MIIGIVCEYNPFHNGHLYQINKIREEFGEDTTIIAVMSGNYTQRGETAIADKTLRAKCAVLSGVDLVLELPFPYSSSSAEFFAKAAVSILDSLGVVDRISFGSESGDISLLSRVADIMLSDEYKSRIIDLSRDEKNLKDGYPRISAMLLRELSGDDFDFSPNNILAVEYIKALRELGSQVTPHTIKRIATDHSSEHIIEGEVQSASSIRSLLSKKDISALEYIPNITKNIFLEAIKSGDFPCDQSKLDTAILAHFRLDPPMASEDIQDAKGGLYNRLKDLSLKVTRVESLVTSAESKRFTRARIRRAIINSYIGVTSSDVRTLPEYTQLLAADKSGRRILKSLKKASGITILTKPSDINKLSELGKRQKKLSDKADFIFEFTKPVPKDATFCLKFTPYVK